MQIQSVCRSTELAAAQLKQHFMSQHSWRSGGRPTNNRQQDDYEADDGIDAK